MQNQSCFKQLDAYGEQFSMNVDRQATYKSYVGVILTILLAFGTGAFTYNKANVLLNKTDVDITASRVDKFFEEADQVTADTGFRILLYSRFDGL